MSRQHAGTLLRMVALFAAYVLTAKLGLTFDALAGIATTVWPPTGIAIASLVIGGRVLWPAVFLAAFVVNVTTAIPPWAALIIATGNTLEAVIGATLLSRWRFRRAMDRVQDVMQNGAVAVLATPISAGLGTLAAWLGHLPVKDGYALFWLVWWIGDALGALMIAPLIFTWTAMPRPPARIGRLAEAALLLGFLSLVGAAVFHDFFNQPVVLLTRGSYLVSPLLIWAALRFRQRGTAAALLVVAIAAISGTASGQGVFAPESLHERLFRVQCFMAVSAVSMMMLAAALAERRQAIRARDEFISIASHELKTPLTALRLRLGSAGRLTRAAREEPEKMEKLVHSLAAAGTITDRMSRLIDDLLDVSRLGADRLVLHIEEVKLGGLLSDVVARLRDMAAESGSSVAVDVAESAAATAGSWDRVRLEQVVTNLLSNAIKYGLGQEIVVSARSEGERVFIAIKDHGVGISPADQARIFQAFERVTSVHRVGGLGLGLFIGRRIAEAHGGLLTVASQLGHGSTFTLELQRVAPPQPPEPPSGPPGSLSDDS
jgi:signal transduction histidine kinase